MLLSCCLAICIAGMCFSFILLCYFCAFIFCFFLQFAFFRVASTSYSFFCEAMICLLLDVGRRAHCKLQIVWSMLAVIALSFYACCLWFAILVHLCLVCLLVLCQTCMCSVVSGVSCVLLWLCCCRGSDWWCCLRRCCCCVFFLNVGGRVVLAQVFSNRSTSLRGSRRRYRWQFTMMEMCLVGIFLPICFLEHQEFTSP